MGFFDKFFGGGGIGSSRKEISISGLDAWLGEEFSKLDGRVVSETKPVIAEIFEVKSSLRKQVLGLQDLPWEDLPPKLKNIVKTSKPEYISSMLDILEDMEFEEKADYKSILKFHKDSSNTLENIAKATVGHGRYLPFAYGDAVAGIRKDVKKMIDAHRNLGKIIESFSRITQLDRVKTVKEEFEKTGETRKTVKAKATALKKELKKMEEELSNATAEQNQLVEDKQTLGLRKEVEAASRRLDDIRRDISEGWAVLGRPLRKYKRLAADENRLPQSVLKDIDGFMENPVEQFLLGSNFHVMLEDLEKAVDEGKIEIKNPEKTVKAIKDIIASLKPALIEEYRTLCERRKEIETELNNSAAIQKSKKLETMVGQLKTKISEQNNELEALEKKFLELEVSSGELKKQLEKQLEEVDIILHED